MKKLFILISLVSFLLFTEYAHSQKIYKPYILAAESSEDINSVLEKAKKSLQNNGLKVVGEYTPAEDSKRRIIAFTSDEIINAIKKFDKERGFAAVLRLALTKEKGKVIISYNNPHYWGNAYFQDDYEDVKSVYDKVAKKLKAATKGLGQTKYKEFGSEDGIEDEDLRDYHYMISMPYFEDYIELKEFSSYSNAVKTIENNLKKNKNTIKVYQVEIPGKNITLFGVGLKGETGEKHFMKKIDISNPKHTAFLPYELLVIDNLVIMLHGRYRIAISFPDLSMGTFMKIMSTPGDIEDLMESLTK